MFDKKHYENDKKIKELQIHLDAIRKQETETLKELRKLVYEIENDRRKI